jgi:hypothetical protein
VAVASGDWVQSSGCYRDLAFAINGFTVDCYGLALGSYEMVLEVQWL